MPVSAYRAADRRGLTLIEVIVALALLGLGAALVFPLMWPTPPRVQEEPLQRLVYRARALAVARAEPLRLTIGRDGDWAIVSGVTPDSGAIESGALYAPPAGAAVVRVTELGICLAGISTPGLRQGLTIDAVSCRVTP
ncbi:MAG: prepilin-type N-terminal cleavage/methylation domain-containing protein [Gemmatimonadaceae bacterium]